MLTPKLITKSEQIICRQKDKILIWTKRIISFKENQREGQTENKKLGLLSLLKEVQSSINRLEFTAINTTDIQGTHLNCTCITHIPVTGVSYTDTGRVGSPPSGFQMPTTLIPIKHDNFTFVRKRWKGI